ncbi:hypothetical protein [Microcoleus sp. CAWBG58]|nr:hypothetical protein [Microcoleus sp. CAWBG58]
MNSLILISMPKPEAFNQFFLVRCVAVEFWILVEIFCKRRTLV